MGSYQHGACLIPSASEMSSGCQVPGAGLQPWRHSPRGQARGPWANGREVESHANSCSAEHLLGEVTVVWLSYTYTVHYCHQAVIVLTNNGKQSVSYRPDLLNKEFTVLVSINAMEQNP